MAVEAETAAAADQQTVIPQEDTKLSIQNAVDEEPVASENDALIAKEAPKKKAPNPTGVIATGMFIGSTVLMVYTLLAITFVALLWPKVTPGWAWNGLTWRAVFSPLIAGHLLFFVFDVIVTARVSIMIKTTLTTMLANLSLVALEALVACKLDKIAPVAALPWYLVLIPAYILGLVVLVVPIITHAKDTYVDREGKTQKSGSGVGHKLLGLLICAQAALLAVKLSGVVPWTWGATLTPLWIVAWIAALSAFVPVVLSLLCRQFVQAVMTTMLASGYGLSAGALGFLTVTLFTACIVVCTTPLVIMILVVPQLEAANPSLLAPFIVAFILTGFAAFLAMAFAGVFMGVALKIGFEGVDLSALRPTNAVANAINTANEVRAQKKTDEYEEVKKPEETYTKADATPAADAPAAAGEDAAAASV